MMQVYTIGAEICANLKDKLPCSEKYGAPEEFHQSLYTIVFMAFRIDIEELIEIEKLLKDKMGNGFVVKGQHDETVVDPSVAMHIEFKRKNDG